MLKKRQYLNKLDMQINKLNLCMKVTGANIINIFPGNKFIKC